MWLKVKLSEFVVFIQLCVCVWSESVLPCTVDVATCGDTCSKKLDCGLHTCSMRCHKGACETCRQVQKHAHAHAISLISAIMCVYVQEVEKTCRCGRYSKNLPCHKEYLCESKCNKTRTCGRHQCKRKVHRQTYLVLLSYHTLINLYTHLTVKNVVAVDLVFLCLLSVSV